MFLSRVVLFQLQESARYLVAKDDTAGALASLRNITKINGQSLTWSHADVVDSVSVLYGEGYDATGESSPIDGNGNVEEEEQGLFAARLNDVEVGEEYRRTSESSRRPSIVSHSNLRRTLRKAKVDEGGRLGEWIWNSSFINSLPYDIADSAEDYFERIEMLFVKKLSRTTKLVWSIWALVSAAYTIFNVFLPKWIEIKLGVANDGKVGGQLQKSLEDCKLHSLLVHLRDRYSTRSLSRFAIHDFWIAWQYHRRWISCNNRASSDIELVNFSDLAFRPHFPPRIISDWGYN
jgi:hypothetical protein